MSTRLFHRFSNLKRNRMIVSHYSCALSVCWPSCFGFYKFLLYFCYWNLSCGLDCGSKKEKHVIFAEHFKLNVLCLTCDSWQNVVLYFIFQKWNWTKSERIRKVSVTCFGSKERGTRITNQAVSKTKVSMHVRARLHTHTHTRTPCFVDHTTLFFPGNTAKSSHIWWSKGASLWSKQLNVNVTVVHTYFYIVVDTQRACRTLKLNVRFLRLLKDNGGYNVTCSLCRLFSDKQW
jgi:hypothetical protein